MIRMTASLEWFITKYHPELLVPLALGHVEDLTDEIWEEYRRWLFDSNEANDYLYGGKYYHPPR